MSKNFMKDNWDSIFKPVVVLLSICIIIPLALALTNAVTKDPIAKQETKQREDAMAELFPNKTFAEIDGYTYDTAAVAKDGDQIAGYVITTAAKGYGGDVKVMTAIQADGTLKAVKILSVDNETPGLGQNATKESFYGQFAGMAAQPFSINKTNPNAANNEIKPITGATITSTAVKNAVNEALEIYENVKEEK